MIYLLDVNVLLAMKYEGHVHYARHLIELATTHGVRFATLDKGIPTAELVPDWPVAPGVREEAPAYGMVA